MKRRPRSIIHPVNSAIASLTGIVGLIIAAGPSEATSGNRMSAAECTEYNAALIPDLPQQVDDATIWTRFLCSYFDGRPSAFFVYELVGDVANRESFPNEFKDQIISNWCSDDEGRAALRADVTVHLEYFRKDGSYVDSLRIIEADC